MDGEGGVSTGNERTAYKLKSYFDLAKEEIAKAVRAEECGLPDDAVSNYQNAQRILSEAISTPVPCGGSGAMDGEGGVSTGNERTAYKLKSYFDLAKEEIAKAVRAEECGLPDDAVSNYQNAQRILSEAISTPVPSYISSSEMEKVTSYRQKISKWQSQVADRLQTLTRRTGGSSEIKSTSAKLQTAAVPSTASHPRKVAAQESSGHGRAGPALLMEATVAGGDEEENRRPPATTAEMVRYQAGTRKRNFAWIIELFLGALLVALEAVRREFTPETKTKKNRGSGGCSPSRLSRSQVHGRTALTVLLYAIPTIMCMLSFFRYHHAVTSVSPWPIFFFYLHTAYYVIAMVFGAYGMAGQLSDDFTLGTAIVIMALLLIEYLTKFLYKCCKSKSGSEGGAAEADGGAAETGGIVDQADYTVQTLEPMEADGGGEEAEGVRAMEGGDENGGVEAEADGRDENGGMEANDVGGDGGGGAAEAEGGAAETGGIVDQADYTVQTLEPMEADGGGEEAEGVRAMEGGDENGGVEAEADGRDENGGMEANDVGGDGGGGAAEAEGGGVETEARGTGLPSSVQDFCIENGNIAQAVVGFVKSTLGPFGLDKAVENFKASAAAQNQSNNAKHESAKALPKQPESSRVLNAKSEPSVAFLKPKSPTLPPDFFDDRETKRQKNVEDPMSAKNQLAEASVSRNGTDRSSSVESKQMGKPEFRTSKDFSQVSKSDSVSESKQAKGSLPQGFFDDKDAELRARGITPVKPDPKDEYKEFEKLIKEDLQEIDNRLEEEEFDAAEMIEEEETVEQRSYVERVDMLRRKKLELRASRSAAAAAKSTKVKHQDSSSEDSLSDDEDNENFKVDWRAKHL